MASNESSSNQRPPLGPEGGDTPSPVRPVKRGGHPPAEKATVAPEDHDEGHEMAGPNQRQRRAKPAPSNPESQTAGELLADNSPASLPASSADNLDLMLAGYTYELSPERIAQSPAEPRDRSRLLVVDSPTTTQHRQFRELPEVLRQGDLLVLNNTLVIPARLYGRKTSGAGAEVLLLEEKAPEVWLALVRPGKRLPVGATIEFFPHDHSPTAPHPPLAEGDRLRAKILEVDGPTGGRLLQFQVPGGLPLISVLARWGTMPLPPYITESQAPDDRYQTVYAARPGSAAAPTAGLHFTPELLARLGAVGIDHAFVTLHVGVGTFRPVEVTDITTHKMHAEWAEICADTAAKIRATRARGGRVIAVGTTVTRSLETAAAASPTGQIEAFCGKTNLFIYPGYQWRAIDGLLTNFHLPRSSLMMLVAAFIGRSRMIELYQEVLNAPPDELGQVYRFYSFGDAMLCLPESKLAPSSTP